MDDLQIERIKRYLVWTIGILAGVSVVVIVGTYLWFSSGLFNQPNNNTAANGSNPATAPKTEAQIIESLTAPATPAATNDSGATSTASAKQSTYVQAPSSLNAPAKPNGASASNSSPEEQQQIIDSLTAPSK